LPPCPPAAGLNADDALRVVDCADALRCGGGGECWWGSTEIGGRVLLLLLLLPSPLIVAGAEWSVLGSSEELGSVVGFSFLITANGSMASPSLGSLRCGS